MTVVAGRVTGMAGTSSQFAVLLDNGSWATVWDGGGSASGPVLPAGGTMRAITDDGTDLWAAGLVDGGLAAVEAERQAKTAATTRPTTGPTTTLAATRPAAARLVVFHAKPDGWDGVFELPADRTPDTAEAVSLAVIEGQPIVACGDGAGGVRVLRPAAGGAWDVVADRRPPAGKSFAAVDLIVTDGGPLLWAAVADGPGEIVPLAGPAATTQPEAATRPATAVELAWPGSDKPLGAAAAAYAGEYLRVFARPADGRPDDDPYEQRYDVSPGHHADPVGEPASIEAGAEADRGSVPTWLQVLVLASITFSAGAGVYRYLSAGPKDKLATAADAPRPAALGPRLKAGSVDAIPMLAAILAAAIGARTTTWGGGSSLTTVLILLVGAALYVGHTTLLEVTTGRSIGKRLFGLKVVRVDGSTPTPGQLAGRNLLRVCDPVVLLTISPLGQRSADVAMGTMVVSAAEPAETVADAVDDQGGDRPGGA